ncbi:hypothetical protein CIRG_04220 [Coccidioides immitis RMSCC 2394]|uniref:Uncharacterized protein n=1 Tax=Coccidioides immitis RMSCC 2394 TaxID=404692 RepID=A0A0J6YBW8_COCIT|nr:hypothetical protein CIRG_04220 [Coccidioides immitis RMSCC 2394]
MWRANDNPFLGISPKIVISYVWMYVYPGLKVEEGDAHVLLRLQKRELTYTYRCAKFKQQLSRNVTLHGPCLGCHFRALLVGNLRSSSQQHPEPRLHSGAKGTPANVTLRYIDECNPWMRQPHLLGAKTKLHGHNTYTRKSSPRN